MPAAFDTLIAQSVARWGSALGVSVPADLVRALIAQESGGNTNAVGKAGEIGLMQVRPDTARALGVSDPRLLFDPQVGIDVGVHYLAEQLSRYGGNVPRAVAAYNAGTVKYGTDERFTNQSYVDAVLAIYRQLTASPAGAGALVVLGVLALVFILSGGRGSLGARRSW